MRSFEIFVTADSVAVDTTRREKRPALDVFIEGANVTARVAEAQASCVLRDLGSALALLSRRPRGKAMVRFYDEPLEMCVERLGPKAQLSLYRTGAEPSVLVYDRAVPFDEVMGGVEEAIRQQLARGGVARPVALELGAVEHELALARDRAVDDDAFPTEPVPVVLDLDDDAPVSLGAEFAVRPAAQSEVTDTSVERADLHALLFRGRMRARIRGRAIELAQAHPFLVAERLVELSRRVLDAYERGLPYHVRADVGGAIVGVRLSTEGRLALTLGSEGRGRGTEGALYTFPQLAVADFVEGVLAFGRALVRALLRRDRGQCNNLRLSAFRRQVRETTASLAETHREDAKINPAPETYRAFAEVTRPGSSAPSATSAENLRGTRLRYEARWRALVPGIDLRSTFLCGERLIVGAAAATFCLERATGQVIWRNDSERATCVVTPSGLARILPDGALTLHDFATGDTRLRVKLTPRASGPVAGAVVHGPGLPRLLVVTEGDHHLVAVDLTSGEPRWRWSWGKRSAKASPGTARLRRGGRLLYFTSGDSALTALDAMTGAVVWRLRDRLRFRGPITLDHDILFAIAGGVGCAAQLHAIDAFSGQERWSRPVLEPATACTVEAPPLVAGRTVAVPVRERERARLVAFDRETGAAAWSTPADAPRAPTRIPAGTSWLGIDEIFVGNTTLGDLVAVNATTGELVYRIVLGRVLESDVPRRLEPVLRSGRWDRARRSRIFSVSTSAATSTSPRRAATSSPSARFPG